MSALTVRPATREDAGQIAGVHVRSWQVAYRGIVNDKYLDGLDIAARAERHREHLADPVDWPMLVCERAGKVLAFCTFGVGAADDRPVGEIYALYVDPDAWSVGAGRALMQDALERLGALGHRDVVVWVLTANERARRFYERAGFICEPVVSTIPHLGHVTQIRYRRSA